MRAYAGILNQLQQNTEYTVAIGYPWQEASISPAFRDPCSQHLYPGFCDNETDENVRECGSLP